MYIMSLIGIDLQCYKNLKLNCVFLTFLEWVCPGECMCVFVYIIYIKKIYRSI